MFPVLYSPNEPVGIFSMLFYQEAYLYADPDPKHWRGPQHCFFLMNSCFYQHIKFFPADVNVALVSIDDTPWHRVVCFYTVENLSQQ